MTIAELQAKLELWRDRLALRDWRIVLLVGGCEDEGSYFEVERSIIYQRGVLHVQPWLLGGPVPDHILFRDALTDEFVETSLVHELLHLHTRDMAAVVKEDLIGVLAGDVYRQVTKAMERAEEQCVDRLAEALVRSFGAGR